MYNRVTGSWEMEEKQTETHNRQCSYRGGGSCAPTFRASAFVGGLTASALEGREGGWTQFQRRDMLEGQRGCFDVRAAACESGVREQSEE